MESDLEPLEDHIVEVLSAFSETATVRDLRDDLVVSTPVLADVVWTAAPERRGGRDEPFEHRAVRAVLKGCDQQTPTMWRFTGELSAPEYPVPVSFSLGFEYTWRGSDTVGTSFSGSRFTATLLREGMFVVDLPVEGAPRAPAAGGDPRCILGQQSSSKTHRPAFRAEPLEWDAPAGSIPRASQVH